MLNFFKITEPYVKHLRKTDFRVMDKNNHRINLGIVLTIGEINYYVPLSDTKGKDKYFISGTNTISNAFSWNKRMMVILYKNKKIALLRFDYMLPVPDSEIIEVKRKDLTGEYQKKVSNEYKFCNNHIEEIKKKALEIYTVRTTLAQDNTDLSKIISKIQWNDGRRKDFKKYKQNLENTRSGTCDFKKLEESLTRWIKNN